MTTANLRIDADAKQRPSAAVRVRRSCASFGVLIGVTDEVTLAGDPELQAQGVGALLPYGGEGGIRPEQADRLRLILAQLARGSGSGRHGASRPEVAQLKGDRKGTSSVTVSGNWRVTFSFDGKDALDVDYEDYH